MATTYTLINSNVLSSSAASVTFSSIPATFDDLVLQISARSDASAVQDMLLFQFNGDTSTNYSFVRILGNGATASSTASSNLSAAQLTAGADAATATSNTFSNVEIYVPAYRVSQNKPFSMITVQETNAATAYINPSASLWRNTAAITSINIALNTGPNFVSGSSFWLYGIKNS